MAYAVSKPKRASAASAVNEESLGGSQRQRVKAEA
jgi:hypothetical protein